MRRSPLRRSRGGYTLVEIMLVLSIITVLIGAGIYKMKGALDIAKERRVESDLSTITTELRTYEMEALSLPSNEQGLDALVHRPTSEPVPERWHQLTDSLPTDPWNMPYQYRYPGKHNADGFDLYSLGPDRVESDDDIGNWK